MTARIGLLSLLALLAAGAARAEERGAAARVNGVEISAERLERYHDEVMGSRDFLSMSNPGLFKRRKREALEQLVEQELLWQEAQRKGAVVPQQEVDAALAQLRARFASDAELAQRLDRGGFTPSTYGEYLRHLLSIQRLVERVVAPRLAIGDEEVHASYEAERARGGGDLAAEAEAGPAIRKKLLAAKVNRAVAERVAALRAEARIEIGPAF
jgi:parvulin-like peptidyl-prolyl isomerase